MCVCFFFLKVEYKNYTVIHLDWHLYERHLLKIIRITEQQYIVILCTGIRRYLFVFRNYYNLKPIWKMMKTNLARPWWTVFVLWVFFIQSIERFSLSISVVCLTVTHENWETFIFLFCSSTTTMIPSPLSVDSSWDFILIFTYRCYYYFIFFSEQPV